MDKPAKILQYTRLFMKSISIIDSGKCLAWMDDDPFFTRPAFDPGAEQAAATVLAEIQAHGESAIRAAVARFDGVDLGDAPLCHAVEALCPANREVPADVRDAIRLSHARVRAFAKAGMRRDWSMPTPHGGRLGERFRPFDRVGVYVPGGEAPLVSTVLMTVTLARAAGVPEVLVCTPPRPDGTINPILLHAMRVAGATWVCPVGGIQAIGLMAFGTASIAPVQKIVGPGGAYVTAAKRQVYGRVALDLVAGPSEIAVLADATAPARLVAVDLLSQIEHGTGHERALLVTTSKKLARAVAAALPREAATLSRAAFLQSVMDRNIRLVVAPSLAQGASICNRFAPEHLELLVAEPRRWVSSIDAAGAIFLGRWTPESAGDFVAGPSHVLPTGGAARLFSGLTVDDFRRRTSLIRFSRADLVATRAAIETFGRIEGLDAHGRAATIRFA